METLAIGEQKVFTDVTLEVVRQDNASCIGCWFYANPPLCFTSPLKTIMGQCASWNRADGKDVIFKAIKETT